MRSPQTLTQRLVPALAVTVLATLVFGAVVVTADVAGPQDPSVPTTFGVAAPRQGDAWRYNVTLAGEWTFGLEDVVPLGNETPFADYAWLGHATVRGGDGRLHDANRLSVQQLSYDPQWMEEVEVEDETSEDGYRIEHETPETPYWNTVDDAAWVLAGGNAVVSRGMHYAENHTDTNYGYLPPPMPGVGASYTREWMESGFVQFPDDETPCLVFNALQGTNVSLADPVVLFKGCSFAGELLEVPDGLAFRALGVVELDGVQAVRFRAEHNGTIDVHFTPAVPYPVRIELDLVSQRVATLDGDSDYELGRDVPGRRSASIVMQGFTAGAEPLDAVDDPADPAPAPEFVQAPPMMVGTLRVGPDESGIEHPFPLSMAIAKALEDTSFTDLRIFLGSHPNAYVAAAEYQEGNWGYFGSFTGTVPSYDRVWSIGLTDGDRRDVLGFSVAQQTYEEMLPVAARGAADGENTTVYAFQRDGGPRGYWESAPYPGSLPDTMPTVASMAARWAAFDGSGTPLNAWGFTYACANQFEEEACQLDAQFAAGHVRRKEGQTGVFRMPFPLPGDPYGTEESVHIERAVAFDADGRASLLVAEDYRRETAAAPIEGITGDGIPPVFPPAQQPPRGLQSTAVTGIPVDTWLPEPKQAAGIGFLGLVVGFLYWIWPKLGLVGLFSRLERGELLDHPARQKLVQIVESQPGIHFHDLATKAELANGTAVHHLRKLTDSGHLSVRRSGRYTCYFPGGRVDAHAAAAAPLLKSDGAKLVLDHVRNKPGMSNLELAQATGLQPSTVNYHVQRLSQAGLVSPLRDGRHVRLHPGARAGAIGDAAA